MPARAPLLIASLLPLLSTMTLPVYAQRAGGQPPVAVPPSAPAAAPVATAPADQKVDEAKRTADDAKKSADDARKTADETKKTADDSKKTADETKKTADAAKKTADAAAADAKSAADATTEAKLADLKAGKFIRYGLTAGVAFAVETPSLGSKTFADQANAGATTMPYVLFVPGYWSKGDIEVAYCSALYSGDPVAAMSAANAYARSKIAAGLSPADKREYDAALITLKNGPPSSDSADEKRKYEAAEATEKRFEVKVAEIWDTTKGTWCWTTRLGLWAGKPLSYDANVSLGSDEASKRSVDSLFSFGLAYTPNSYVTFLAGAAVNSVTVRGAAVTATTPAGADRLKHMTSLVFGFGGNIDTLGILFSK